MASCVNETCFLNVADSATLTRCPWPTELVSEYHYEASRLNFFLHGMLPDSRLASIRELLTVPEHKEYIHIQFAADREEPPAWHWLLGYAHSLGEVCHLAHYAATRSWDVGWDDLSQALSEFGELAVAQQLEREGADWRVLLQVHTNDASAMDWYGGGVLHFIIPEANLRNHDFSFVSAAVQSL